MRHDSIRDLLKQEIENAGFTVEIERNAGSDDRSRPGDLKVLRWKGRDLYIDVSCVNPMTMKWRGAVAESGIGAAAGDCELEKLKKYKGKIDERTAVFLPFIMETQGGLGAAAREFLIEVAKIKNRRTNNSAGQASSIANLDVMI